MKKNFQKSNALLKQCLELIPLASQTFSKSYLQYPEGISPLFIDKAEGAKIWDIDGNCFIDLVSSLMAIVLGYNDQDVNHAIRVQLDKGISFSLATDLEYQLASLLTELIPCAEMVRFGKTGTDVTSAAIRLARAYTKRDRVLVCGYHGWQDWYIGTTSRKLGVPEDVANLSKSVPYNDLESVENELRTNQYAAFIMEPTNTTTPNPGYLEGIRALTTKHDTVLVFDEIVTGFHFSLGGAQEYFGVTPDLACFGKGLGNGMPISAIVGKREIMKFMDQIFFSGTFGGEALSIAASIEVIKKMQRQPVIEHLWNFGQKLSDGVLEIINNLNLQDVVKFMGYAPWKIISFLDFKNISAATIKTFFQKEMIRNGVLILSSHNISFAMNEEAFETIMNAYKLTLEKLAEHLLMGDLCANLECPVIQPIFKVR